ncbi:hypothetical protein CRI88_17450 [Lysinibacillus fusiformis]|uniref:Uncharacterized protein n=1 Tax=Lysinibacillus fusiformis TaxID=28031 RepID=A0A2I0UWZ1_9BACI|nr:hypothetical protein CRI88_17450 [Lysinibacillus fusiformis]
MKVFTTLLWRGVVTSSYPQSKNISYIINKPFLLAGRPFAGMVGGVGPGILLEDLSIWVGPGAESHDE